MDALRTGVFVLFVLLVPVSCQESLFTEPVICYFLDGILIFYCIVATALFFKEKFSHIPSVPTEQAENGAIYQELERPKDADPYQVLEPSKRKKKAAKKKRTESTQAAETDKDTYESLVPLASASPVSPE